MHDRPTELCKLVQDMSLETGTFRTNVWNLKCKSTKYGWRGSATEKNTIYGHHLTGDVRQQGQIISVLCWHKNNPDYRQERTKQGALSGRDYRNVHSASWQREGLCHGFWLTDSSQCEQCEWSLTCQENFKFICRVPSHEGALFLRKRLKQRT